jgi:hypothetical protein
MRVVTAKVKKKKKRATISRMDTKSHRECTKCSRLSAVSINIYYVFWTSNQNTTYRNQSDRGPRLVIEPSLATFEEVNQKLWSVERWLFILV